jgi:hypothetical protein
MRVTGTGEYASGDRTHDSPLAEKERRYLFSVFKPIARRLAYYRGVIS